MTKFGSADNGKCCTVINLDDTGSQSVNKPTPMPCKPPSAKSKAALIQNRIVRLAIIAVMSVICIASASCHTLFAQPFKTMKADPSIKDQTKSDKEFKSPLLFALATSGSFPIAFAFWLISTRGRIVAPTWRQWKAFAMLAVPESLNIIFSSFGLSKLSATEYAIIRGTSLIFVVGLSKLMTKKKFNEWQYLAVFMMAVALALIGFNSDTKSELSVWDHVIGFSCAVSGSIFVSILSVLTQKLFATEQSKGDLTFICQINTCQSFLSTLIVLPCFLFFERSTIRETYPHVIALGNGSMFWGLLAGMWVASPLMLFTNIGLTSFSSATFSRSLGGPKRVVCVILGHLLFNEELNAFAIIATVLLFFSLGIYIYGGHRLQQSKLRSISGGHRRQQSKLWCIIGGHRPQQSNLQSK